MHEVYPNIVIIRQLKKTDWTSYSKIAEDAFPDEFDERSEKEFSITVKREKNRFIGFFDDQELLGFVYFQLYSELSWLRSIAISDKHRGKGNGNTIMEYVLGRFREHPSSKAMLYVETNNEVAISLYKKYGFMVNKESWHFIIPVSDFGRDVEGVSLDNYSLKELSSKDLTQVILKFPNVNEEQMKSQMEAQVKSQMEAQVKSQIEKIEDDKKSTLYFLGLYHYDELVGFSRFSTGFSGSMPFEYLQINQADIMIKLLETHYKLQDKEYIRITFDNYKELAELCTKRGYKLHHHMFTMKVNL